MGKRPAVEGSLGMCEPPCKKATIPAVSDDALPATLPANEHVKEEPVVSVMDCVAKMKSTLMALKEEILEFPAFALQC